MRAVRRQETTGELVVVSTCDPCNLVGVLTPGDKIPAIPGHAVVFRDGVPIAYRGADGVAWLVELERDEQSEVERVLKSAHRAVRASTGRSLW